MVQDSLKLLNEGVTPLLDSISSLNYWIWIAIVEFVVIIVMIFRNSFNRHETSKSKFKRDALEQEVDFDNLINSSFNSIQLYDQLKVKCHPDRFATDKEMNQIAEALFQEITRNKTNVKRLVELQEEAVRKLKVKF